MLQEKIITQNGEEFQLLSYVLYFQAALWLVKEAEEGEDSWKEKESGSEKGKPGRNVFAYFFREICCFSRVLLIFIIMERKLVSRSVILGFSLLSGLFLLGLFIFRGLKTFSDKDRVVTVKGLAEMNMKATSAAIDLNFSFSGDDLQDIIKQTENKKNAIIAYLTNIGYSENDITINNIGVTDRQKYYETRWENGQQVQVKINRYTISQSLAIQSKDIEKTEDRIAQIQLDLVSKDLTSHITANYSFPELNSIKPQLIAESTKNARIAGEQFANDSQAKLGKIKTASQGQITIAGSYYYYDEEISEKPKEPYIQKARVVSTIVFFLE